MTDKTSKSWMAAGETDDPNADIHQILTVEQTTKLKQTFIRSNHPRFKREFAVSRNQPFGKTSDYITSFEIADFTKKAKLIKLVGMLMQTKVYLFR